MGSRAQLNAATLSDVFEFSADEGLGLFEDGKGTQAPRNVQHLHEEANKPACCPNRWECKHHGPSEDHRTPEGRLPEKHVSGSQVPHWKSSPAGNEKSSSHGCSGQIHLHMETTSTHNTNSGKNGIVESDADSDSSTADSENEDSDSDFIDTYDVAARKTPRVRKSADVTNSPSRKRTGTCSGQKGKEVRRHSTPPPLVLQPRSTNTSPQLQANAGKYKGATRARVPRKPTRLTDEERLR